MDIREGSYLIEVILYNEDMVAVLCAGHTYVYKVVGEWGHEAWVESISCDHPGEILEVRDDGWHVMIKTTSGYNEIELRCEYGYDAWLKRVD